MKMFLNALRRPMQQNPVEAYRRRVQKEVDPSQLLQGDPEDRLHGLECALSRAKSRTLLDVGCHDGTVAKAFAKNGCCLIDGVDLSPAAVEAARSKLASEEASSMFEQADLAQGVEHLEEKLRRSQYSIVCYLGVHHHLHGQMEPAAILALEQALFDKAEELFVLRVSRRYIDELSDRVRRAGFEPITNIVEGRVGPAVTYARKEKI